MSSILQKIENSYINKLPFVAYRKPQTDNLYGYFQVDDSLNYVNNYSESGFVFAPFDNSTPSILIPEEKSKFVQEIYVINNADIKTSIFLDDESSRAKHISLVQKGIKAIQEKAFKKVVLSREDKVEMGNFSIRNSFEYLLNTYDHAFVYVWFHPKVGLWLGATPESLTKVQGDSFKTMALAGTQAFKGNMNVDWGNKEIEEHQIVVDYMVSELKKYIELQNILISDTYTIRAGDLLHLRADINGKSKQLNIKKLLESIHPTPAVCGFPKEVSRDFILSHENYDRTFYTGYLGELNLQNESNLFVNLRCMEIKGAIAHIYIGGGITKDSIPENEWEETNLKTHTMKKAIN